MKISVSTNGVNNLASAPSRLMAKVQTYFKKPRPRFFFREWRKHRGLTQEMLGDRIGTSASSISQLESGKQGFTDSTLIAIADALRCGPGDLLMRNPLDPEAPWSIWESIKPERRPQALAVLRAFAETQDKTGTSG